VQILARVDDRAALINKSRLWLKAWAMSCAGERDAALEGPNLLEASKGEPASNFENWRRVSMEFSKTSAKNSIQGLVFNYTFQ